MQFGNEGINGTRDGLCHGLDDRTWRAGPLAFELEPGITRPVLKSGTMPKPVRQRGMKLLCFSSRLIAMVRLWTFVLSKAVSVCGC